MAEILALRGLPIWLRDVPGIVFRSDNEPFKNHMQQYAKIIVNLLKSERLFASQGGPIILSQIENEYGMVQKAFGEKGKAYLQWTAKLAVELDTGVPWVMCKQDDAPDPVINACNGRRCGETFAGPNSPNKPAIWTENWTTSYEVYGKEPRLRSAEDIAFHVVLFIAKKGSYVNYYMYHGGTNFGRTGSEYVLTSYYDKAPLDEYGLLRQPKWGHLKELHAAIKLCSRPLLSGVQTKMSLGDQQEAFVFRENSQVCAAFLVNNDIRRNVMVQFQNISYELPPKSISILPDCKIVAFNTAKVTTQYTTRSMQPSKRFDSIENWEEYKEPIPTFDETSLRANTILEQMNTTKDTSDYLWYTFRYEHQSSKTKSVLRVEHLGHVLHAFVNGQFAGYGHGSFDQKRFIMENTISLNNGTNYVSLLSVTVGLPDSGPHLERQAAGLRSLRIQRTKGYLDDFQDYPWGYQVGLVGEKLKIYTENGARKIQWSKHNNSTHQPLTWYKTFFDAPPGRDPVALDLGSMGKGEAWINGESIGRYWVSILTRGSPSQTWYNIPRSFLKTTGNLLVIFEEEKGNPAEISVDTVSITKVCGQVSKSHPPPVISWRGQQQDEPVEKTRHHGRRPKVNLRCPPGRNISKILFASFGTPSGDCQNYSVGACHSSHSLPVAKRACVGKNKCSIPLRNDRFGGDPCPGISKSLLVDALCT